MAEMPSRLRDLLSSFGRQLGLNQAVATGELWARWAEIVGAHIAQHAEPSSLKDGVLRIRTDSPAWATEVGYLGPEIARRANDLLARDLVMEVRVWTGPGPIRGASPVGSGGPRAASVKPPKEPRHEGPEDALAAARAAWLQRRRRPS